MIGSLAACKKQNSLDCFKSTGKDVREIRYPSNFSEIELNDKIEVTVLKGTEFKVEVLAGEHVIKNITTHVINNKLIINNINKCNFVRGYKRVVKVFVTVPSIRRLTNVGVGLITLGDYFQQDSLEVVAESSGDIHANGYFRYLVTSSHGNGDIYLNGLCDTLYVYSNGTNFLLAQNLLVNKYMFVETLTLGDCYVNTNNLPRFEYNIHRSGNIYYEGQAAVVIDYSDGSASGKAIRKD